MAQAPNPEMTPELRAAITRGVIADTVLLGAGFILFFATGEAAWIIAGMIVASLLFVFLLAQAGAFAGKDERR